MHALPCPGPRKNGCPGLPNPENAPSLTVTLPCTEARKGCPCIPAWERLVLHSVSKKTSKKINFQTQGLPASGDWACAPWLQQHYVNNFFWDTLYYVCSLTLNETIDMPPDVVHAAFEFNNMETVIDSTARIKMAISKFSLIKSIHLSLREVDCSLARLYNSFL